MRSSNYLLLLAGPVVAGCSVASSSWNQYAVAVEQPRPGEAAASIAAAPAPTVLDLPPLGTTPRVIPRREAALAVLERRVGELSHPAALQLAFQAYWNYRNAHPEQVRNPYFYFVDYGLDSRQPRGYVFDMDALELVEGPFTVAHGRGSADGRHGVPTRFTNIMDSATTSLGLYLAQETYSFSGTSGGRRYHSIGLRLKGVSGRFNSAARRRGIVVHGAPYVTPSRAGRSEGCPAMELSRAQRLIPLIANGGLVLHFSPLDARWMREDPWIARSGSRLAAAE